MPSRRSASPISMTMLPNTWIFGVYLHGELCSSVRISVADVRNGGRRPRPRCSAISCIPTRPRRGHHRSDPFRRGSREGQAVPGTALCDGAAGLYGLRAISMPISALRSFAPSIRRSIAASSCTRPLPSRGCFPGLLKPVGLMAADFPAMREKVFERFPYHALERLRTADAVRAQRRARLPSADAVGRHVRARLDRPAVLNGESAPSSAFRAAEFLPGAPRRLCRFVTKSVDRPENRSSGRRRRGLPSPSRHIYNPLTIAVAFRRLGAFDRLRQHPIKVDGTFA